VIDIRSKDSKGRVSNGTKAIQLALAKTQPLSPIKRKDDHGSWEDPISQSEFIKAEQSAKTPLCYAGSGNAGYTNTIVYTK
jgi:hypothetical protein